MLAAERLKGESNIVIKDKKKHKEEKLPSTSNQQSVEDIIDEMSKMIKSLTSKLSKLDMEGKIATIPIQEARNRNPNQY